jgi:hypothetical protein
MACRCGGTEDSSKRTMFLIESGGWDGNARLLRDDGLSVAGNGRWILGDKGGYTSATH